MLETKPKFKLDERVRFYLQDGEFIGNVNKVYRSSDNKYWRYDVIFYLSEHIKHYLCPQEYKGLHEKQLEKTEDNKE